MKVFLGSSFSPNMLPRGKGVVASFTPITTERLLQDFSFLDSSGIHIKSVVGHADTAAVMSSFLSREVLYNRETVKVYPGDALYIAQVVGSRLPPGAITLPEDASFEWYLITFTYSDFRDYFPLL